MARPNLEAQLTDFPASTMDILPTIVDLLELPKDSMLTVHDGESIAALFQGKIPRRTHSIPFRFTSNKALIDGDYKLIGTSQRKDNQWRLYDLRSDPGESKDLATELPERFARMQAEAEATLRSVEASAAGKDYPEGKILQTPRNAFWRDMAEYKPHLETFSSRSKSSDPQKKAGRASKKEKSE